MDRTRDAAHARDRRRDLAEIHGPRCSALAGDHRDTVMLGRTHGQPGLPITFGFKAAVWAAELARHRERIDEAEPRLAVGQLAGAVGTLSAGTTAGPELQRAASSGSASASRRSAGPRARPRRGVRGPARAGHRHAREDRQRGLQPPAGRDRRAGRGARTASSAASRCRRSGTRSAPSTSGRWRASCARGRPRARGPGLRARARRRGVEDRVGARPARRAAPPRPRSRWARAGRGAAGRRRADAREPRRAGRLRARGAGRARARRASRAPPRARARPRRGAARAASRDARRGAGRRAGHHGAPRAGAAGRAAAGRAGARLDEQIVARGRAG